MTKEEDFYPQLVGNFSEEPLKEGPVPEYAVMYSSSIRNITQYKAILKVRFQIGLLAYEGEDLISS